MSARPTLEAVQAPLRPIFGFLISIGTIAGVALALVCLINRDHLIAAGLAALACAGFVALFRDARLDTSRDRNGSMCADR